MNDVHDRSRQFVMVPYDVIEAISRPIDLAVWVVLKKFANDRGAAHPSRLTLAKLLGLKDGKSVDPSLNRLKKLGLVETFPRWRDASGKIHYSPEGESPSRTTNGYVVYDVPKVGKNPPPPYGESSPTPYGRFSQGVGEKSGQELDPSELDPFELDTPCSPPEGDAPAKKPAKRRKTGTTLPEDWTPSPDLRARVAEKCPDIDQEWHFTKFRNYWLSTAGAKGRKSNWDRTYENWMMREQERSPQRSGTNPNASRLPAKAERIKNLTMSMMADGQDGKEITWPANGQ